MARYTFTAPYQLAADVLEDQIWNTLILPATTDVTLTTSQQDIAGTSLTFYVPELGYNAVIEFSAIFEFSANGITDVGVGILVLDGVAQLPQAIHQITGRENQAQQWHVSLAGGASHTAKLAVVKFGTTNVLTLFSAHSSLIVEGPGIY